MPFDIHITFEEIGSDVGFSSNGLIQVHAICLASFWCFKSNSFDYSAVGGSCSLQERDFP